jgi:hypothetical protein
MAKPSMRDCRQAPGDIQVREGGHARLPFINYCMSCDHQLGLSDEKSDAGPFNHLEAYPDHVVIQVEGRLAIYRKKD